MDHSEHTLKQYDVELESVRARVMQMGGLVERQVRLAIESLTNGDVALMDRIISDDHRVNALEVSIDKVAPRSSPAANRQQSTCAW